MSWIGRLSMATRAFISTLRGYSDPSRASVERSARLAEYDLFWSLYQNSIFDRALGDLWVKHKNDQRLVAYIRSLYNPCAKLVDFYVASTYPGVVASDGQELPGGIPLAVPLAKDTDEDLKAAVGQLLRWSNWQTAKDLYVTYGAAVGDVALEIDDAVDRSKVLLLPRWPGHVVDLERDDEGNVTFYALEYETSDVTRTGKTVTEERWTYRKEVDRETIREYRDEAVTRNDPNPYGFVPFVWVQHRQRGGDHGAPAIAGSLPKLEAINHLLSILIKDTEKVARSPKVLATSSTLAPALSAEAQAVLDSAEITLDLLKGNPDTTVHDIGTNLDVAAVLEAIKTIISFVERDHPEITFYEKLREMSQVTGPAARRLVGDSQGNLTRAAACYDDGLNRALQMGISVAAIRYPSWAKKATAQQVFAKFNAGSYDRGDLDFQIMPRAIIEETADERWQAEILRSQVASGWAEFTGSKVFGLDRAGFSEDDLRTFFTDRADLIAAERLLNESDLDADGEPPPSL